MSARTETLRTNRPIGFATWGAWIIAALLATTIAFMYVTGSDRVAPGTSTKAPAGVTATAPSSTGSPAYRTELVKGGLQPAPFAAILTPNQVGGFEARFGSTASKTGTSSDARITLIKGGLQPRPGA